jgi:t-SNARE complex subunit (syntaxin)
MNYVVLDNVNAPDLAHAASQNTRALASSDLKHAHALDFRRATLQNARAFTNYARVLVVIIVVVIVVIIIVVPALALILVLALPTLNNLLRE